MKREEIVRLLPEVFQRTNLPGTPMAALLDAMAVLIDPIEKKLDELDATFNPHRTPDRFVAVLARWVDVDRICEGVAGHDLAGESGPSFPAGLGRLRELCAAAAVLARTRGTPGGFIRYLETATGCRGFVLEEGVTGEDRRPRPFHFRLLAPASAREHRRLLEKLIRLEKPAHATFELELVNQTGE